MHKLAPQESQRGPPVQVQRHKHRGSGCWKAWKEARAGSQLRQRHRKEAHFFLPLPSVQLRPSRDQRVPTRTGEGSLLTRVFRRGSPPETPSRTHTRRQSSLRASHSQSGRPRKPAIPDSSRRIPANKGCFLRIRTESVLDRKWDVTINSGPHCHAATGSPAPRAATGVQGSQGEPLSLLMSKTGLLAHTQGLWFV